ncbi:MAG: thioredoxin family protein [Prevotellaceae bacterium]|jgi:small redox-active disulfide protein 2|nr:thioredoxin family protein [Prevotellaceae bacterium]
MEIKVLGDGCAHCNVLYTHTLQAMEELGLDVLVAQVSDILQILQYRVLSTPALVVDGKVVSAGEVLSVKDIEKILNIKTFS